MKKNKLNTSKAILLISFIAIGFSISIFLFSLIKFIEYSQSTDELNYEIVFDFLVVISTSLISIFGSLIYPINYSMKERHRREESDEWSRSGSEIIGINEIIKTIDKKIEDMEKALDSNELDNFWFMDDPETLRKQKEIFIEKRNNIINNIHGEIVEKPKRDGKKVIRKSINWLKKKTLYISNNKKIKKLSEIDKWYLLIYGHDFLSDLILNDGEYRWKDQKNSKIVLFINPKNKKVRVYIKKHKKNDDYFDHGYWEIETYNSSKYRMFEFVSETLAKVEAVKSKGDPIFSYSRISDYLEYESISKQLVRKNNNLSLNDLYAIKDDLKNITEYEYDNDFLIDFSNDYDDYKNGSNLITYMTFNFIDLKFSDKLKPFLFNWSKFTGLDASSTAFPKGIYEMPDEIQMFSELNSSLFSHSFYPFAPLKYISDWDAIRDFTNITKDFTREDLEALIHRFNMKYPYISVEECYNRKRKTIFRMKFTNDERNKVEIFLLNKYEKMNYIYDLEERTYHEMSYFLESNN